MTRIFVDQPLAPSAELTLSGDVAHYLLNVLRMQPGERFVAVGGEGAFEVVVSGCRAGEVLVAVGEPAGKPRPTGVEITLYQSMLKGDRFELVVQKGTELGVARIVPMLSDRTISRPDPGRLETRLARWQRIALEASRQCGRDDVPEVASLCTFPEALAQWRATLAPGLFPYETVAGDADCALRPVLRSLRPAACLAAFIGPEGGFSLPEADEALGAGLNPVSLGPLILRAETAAIALCANVVYELG